MLFKILGWYSLFFAIVAIVQACLIEDNKANRITGFIIIAPIIYYLLMSVFGMGK